MCRTRDQNMALNKVLRFCTAKHLVPTCPSAHQVPVVCPGFALLSLNRITKITGVMETDNRSQPCPSLRVRTKVPQPRTPIPTTLAGVALGWGRDVLLQPSSGSPSSAV